MGMDSPLRPGISAHPVFLLWWEWTYFKEKQHTQPAPVFCCRNRVATQCLILMWMDSPLTTEIDQETWPTQQFCCGGNQLTTRKLGLLTVSCDGNGLTTETRYLSPPNIFVVMGMDLLQRKTANTTCSVFCSRNRMAACFKDASLRELC